MRLQFTDLHVGFGNHVVLRGVSGSFLPGTVTGLLGPNGAGKSTLLRCLAGLQRPDAGQVLLGDVDASTMTVRQRARHLATVPQTPTVDFRFRVLDVVLMGRHAHLPRFGIETARDHQLALGALERTGTAHLADRDVTTLSGGERQLVFIAKALTQDTPIVLLDEPISALDLRHQLQVMGLMREMATEGRTVVAALHDVSLAARICDGLLVIADHSIAAEGPPEDVLTPDLMRHVYQVEADIGRDPRTGTVTAVAHAPLKETS